jgi:hypothetical protein
LHEKQDMPQSYKNVESYLAECATARFAIATR